MTLEEARQQCEIDSDITEHDTLLTRKIRAATELCESFLLRPIMATTYIESGSEWPYVDGASCCNGCIAPQMTPVQAVIQISYLDSTGTRQVVPIEDYNLVGDEIHLAINTPWPVARAYPGSIAVEYVAGLGSDGSPAVAPPEIVREAVLMTVSHLFENRSATDQALQELPLGVRDLLQPYRRYP